MFYSETLLSKTGPLAKVWLSANLERKLDKRNVLSSKIEESVEAIVNQGEAPLALRLTGQLLLGVVRIYSRKTRYLLDDCNEAILKIKMAFKPGNVDLPANQSHVANPATLTLPDVLTELDLLAPVPDPSLLLGPPGDGDDLLDFSSQRLDSSIEKPRRAIDQPRLEDDLELDLDIDDIEVGRDAPAPRPLRDEADDTTLLDDPGLNLDIGDIDAPRVDNSILPGQDRFDDDGDINMGAFDDDPTLNPAGDDLAPTSGKELHRNSQPPFPESRLSEERHQRDSDLFEPQPEEESVHQAQRAKKRRIIQADADTEIHSGQIRAQQNDRSKILKPLSFLPKDPVLLTLMNMQRNGEFVSNILGDGRSKGWAPELRGVLSLEVVRQSRDLKRKRDAGINVETDDAGRPRIELGSDIGPVLGSDLNIPQDTGFENDDTIHIPGADAADEMPPLSPEEEYGVQDNFDHTEYPILHPKDAGPISQGTKHAVHLLREQFGDTAAESPGQRQKSSVLFQDLLPEETTSRADATKMFFEVLVLATKDAIRVEQKSDVVGAPLRVRARRGLWGDWAELEAGGEIEKPAAVAT